VDFLIRIGVSGIILTGGNNLSSSVKTIDGRNAVDLPEMDDLAPERDETESALLKGSINLKIPVLGVCRGMQVMNIFHGGQIQKIEGHVNINHNLDYIENSWPYSHFLSRRCVNSFHEMGITESDIASNLQILAKAGESVEVFVYDKYRHLGIMWHPERDKLFSKADIGLVNSFFEY
jgi:putative glutamine amidotransferase